MENRDDAKFCNECGKRFDNDSQTGGGDAAATAFGGASDAVEAVPSWYAAAKKKRATEASSGDAASAAPAGATAAVAQRATEASSGGAASAAPAGATAAVAQRATSQDPMKGDPEVGADKITQEETAAIPPVSGSQRQGFAVPPVAGAHDLSGLNTFADGSMTPGNTAQMPKVDGAKADAASGAKRVSAPADRRERRERVKELKRRKREAMREIKGKDPAAGSKAPLIGAVVGAVVLVVIVLAVAYSLELIGGKTIPDTTGMSEADAVYMLQKAGFKTRVSMVKSDETEGLVLLTDPSSGTRVADGSEVVVHVAQSRTIPQVKGKTSEAALELLHESGYTNIADLQYVKTNDAEDGEVLDVSPAEGSKVKSAVPVTLTVASNYRVPDVTGLTQDNATWTLKEAGYEIYVSTVDYESLEEGTVYSSDPVADTKLDEGSYVTIFVVQHRATRLENLAREYLTSQGTVSVGGVTYQVDSVTSTTYQSNGIVNFTMQGSPTTSFLGETITLSSRSVSGSIAFDDNDQVVSIG